MPMVRRVQIPRSYVQTHSAQTRPVIRTCPKHWGFAWVQPTPVQLLDTPPLGTWAKGGGRGVNEVVWPRRPERQHAVDSTHGTPVIIGRGL